jgi:hypothetical protein
MELQQMMEFLLAKINANQAKVDAYQAKMMAEMRVEYEKMRAGLEVKIDAMNAKSDAHQGEMKAQLCSLASRIDANQEEMRAMLDASLGKVEANPGEEMSVEVLGEVSKEEAAANSSGALKKRHVGRKLTAGCRGKPKKRPQGIAACESREITRRAGMARRKGNVVRKNRIRGNVERRAPKLRTVVKRLWKDPECKMGIKDPGTRR